MPRPTTKPNPHESMTEARDPKAYEKELERTEWIMDYVTPRFVFGSGRPEFEHAKTYGLTRRDGKHILLDLDTKKDKMVAELYDAIGCTWHMVEGRYYHHSDETGKRHFYKIGLQNARKMPRALLEKANQYMRDMQVDESDKPAVEESVKKMLVTMGSKKMASFVYGTRVMSRKEVLRDFDRLKKNRRIQIHDSGLAKTYYPRPTSRAFEGNMPPEAMEMQDEEERLYWSRIKRREPIPPEVWKFLENARSGRWLEESNSEAYGEEVARAKDIMRRARLLLFRPKRAGEDVKRVKTHGLSVRGDGKCVLLNLDTEKDEMVAELYEAAGCTHYVAKRRYYRHSDDAGNEHFYSIHTGDGLLLFQPPHAWKEHSCRMDPEGLVPHSVLEAICQHLRGVQVDASDDSAFKETMKKMVVDLQSKAVASCVYGTDIMSRKEVLHDFDRLKDDQGVNIRNGALAKAYHPRPTSRALYGYPAPGVMEMKDKVEELYWRRMENHEPIPPEVWKFLEDVHSGRYLEEYHRKKNEGTGNERPGMPSA